MDLPLFDGVALERLHADVEALSVECGGPKKGRWRCDRNGARYLALENGSSALLPSYTDMRVAAWGARTNNAARLEGLSGLLGPWLADHGLPGPRTVRLRAARSDGVYLCQVALAMRLVKQKPYVTSLRWWKRLFAR